MPHFSVDCVSPFFTFRTEFRFAAIFVYIVVQFCKHVHDSLSCICVHVRIALLFKLADGDLTVSNSVVKPCKT